MKIRVAIFKDPSPKPLEQDINPLPYRGFSFVTYPPPSFKRWALGRHRISYFDIMGGNIESEGLFFRNWYIPFHSNCENKEEENSRPDSNSRHWSYRRRHMLRSLALNNVRRTRSPVTHNGIIVSNPTISTITHLCATEDRVYRTAFLLGARFK